MKAQTELDAWLAADDRFFHSLISLRQAVEAVSLTRPNTLARQEAQRAHEVACQASHDADVECRKAKRTLILARADLTESAVAR